MMSAANGGGYIFAGIADLAWPQATTRHTP